MSVKHKEIKSFSSVKILCLPSDIASQISVTTKALQKKDFHASGLAFAGNNKQEKNGIRVLYRPRLSFISFFYEAYQGFKALFIILKEIYQADIIHWYGGNAVPLGLDVFWAKILGKTGLVEYLGSDIRIPEIASLDNEYLKKYIIKIHSDTDN